MNTRQSGLQSYGTASAQSRLWTAIYRASVEAVHPHQSPPSVDVVLFRYNTRFQAVPFALDPFSAALPQIGDTVAVFMAEGIRDNIWACLDLPRPDNAQPLPSSGTWRFLHPSGVVLQIDDDGNLAALYPSGATVALGGQAHTEFATPDFRVSGATATGTAAFTGTPGAVIPQALPMTGGGYLWYTTAQGVIGSGGTASVPFVCATGGTAPNGLGPTALAFPFEGLTGVSGTASGGAQATTATLDAQSIVLGGTHAVARVGDTISVTTGSGTYVGTITSGSSIVTAG